MGRSKKHTLRSSKSGSGRQGAWIMAGSVAAGILAVLVLGNIQTDSSRHPEPRAESARSIVVSATHYAQYPRVAQVYEMAASATAVLDGLYCYCDCSQHSGHYSLLDCFASDHAARCDVCMSEASIAYQMSRDGASIDAIRAEIDRTYGS